MRSLALVPERGIDAAALDAIEQAVERALAFEVRRQAPVSLPSAAYDEARQQFSAPAVLQWLAARALDDEGDGGAQLAVVAVDLFIPMLRYIFGQAQLGGTFAVVSLARLDQRFYDLPPDPALRDARVAKEALHELGHLEGLRHCSEAPCVMSLSTTIAQVDRKQATFCAACLTLLKERGPR